MDQDGLIHVGGRIRRADVQGDVKHPVIILRRGHLTELLIKHHHLKVNHMGRGMTHNELYQNGYLVINGLSGVARLISSCVTCNFVGAQNELKAALSEMNQDHVQEYLLRNGCEWIPFKMNLPHCSHMGRTWESLIRSVCNA